MLVDSPGTATRGMNFIDTNILLYAFGPEGASDTRPAEARRLLSNGNLAFSIQVFQELYVQATHPRREQPLTFEEAGEVIESLTAFPVQNNDLTVFRSAVEIQSRFQTSFWDANMLAAALSLHCEVVFSEDLSHGQDYGGVKVINPFLDQ